MLDTSNFFEKHYIVAACITWSIFILSWVPLIGIFIVGFTHYHTNWSQRQHNIWWWYQFLTTLVIVAWHPYL